MRRLITGLFGLLVFGAILFAGMEIGLRAMPGELIPIGWLKRFQSDLRLDIAQQLNLPNETQVWELPRNDGGPPLKLFKGNVRTVQKFSKTETSDVTRNAEGFCNTPENTYDRDVIDVMIMGDSFADCVAAAPGQSWMALIGKISGLPVYNIGKGGIGPYEYLQILEYFGLPKNPKIVLMNIYEGNDLRDSTRYHQHVAAVGRGERGYLSAADRYEPELDYETLLDNPLGRNSYAANAGLVVVGKLYDGAKNAIARLGGAERKNVDFHYGFHFDDGTVVPFNIQNADQSEVRYATQLRNGDVTLSAFDDALERLAELAREHGFRPIVSYMPSAYTAYAEFVRFDDDDLTELMPWFSQTQRDYLRNKTAELGMEFYDTTPVLQAAAKELQEKELLYYEANVHHTPAGHRVVGEALAEAVMSR